MSDRILKPKELSARLGCSRVTLWRWAKAEGFPRKIQLSEKSVGWKQSEIEAWLESRKAA